MTPSPPSHEEPAFLALERRRLLPRLVPPLVHKLNNTLAVMQGLGEIDDEPPREGLLVREFESARSLLSRLSNFARDRSPEIETFDLMDVVEGACCLARPVAEGCGVTIELRSPSSATILRSDPQQLEQLVTSILVDEILALGDGFATNGRKHSAPRIRLALRKQARRLVLTLVRPRTGRGDQPPPILSSAAAWAESHGASLYMRSLESVTCYRLVFPAVEIDAPDQNRLEEPRSLFLAEGDGQLCELIKTICTEAGYAVRETADESFDPANVDPERVDLVLFDTDLERRRPGLLRALEDRVHGVGRLLLLGEPPEGSSSSWPFLRKPFRPDELLTAVSRHTH